jgi:branched-chain amino acid transport system substrate-binding protein
MPIPQAVQRRKRRLSGACALVVVVAGAACSSSTKSSSGSTTSAGSSSSSTAQSTTGSATGQATGAPIKVGLICDCSGQVGTIFTPEADVYSAWVKTVNASGGINGHLIDLTIKDDGSNPGTAASDAQTLIADHVDALVDASINTAAWATEAEAAHIPVVGTNTSELYFYTSPDFYDQAQTEDSAVQATLDTAKAAGATNLALFYCAEAPSCHELINAARTYAQKVGVPVVQTQSISLTAPDYTAQCVAAQQAHVSGIYIATSGEIIPKIGTDCTQQGYDPIWVTQGQGFFPTLLTAPGIKDSLWSEYNDLPYWANTPSIQQMNAAVDKYYPTLRGNANLWNQGGAESWPAGLLLEDAVKAGDLGPSDTPSAAEITKGLESLHGDTLQGWAPPLTFPAGQPHPIDCWFTARLQNGVPSLTNGGKVTCANGTSS